MYQFLVLNLHIVMYLSSGEQYAMVLACGLNLTVWSQMEEMIGLSFFVVHVILFLYKSKNTFNI